MTRPPSHSAGATRSRMMIDPHSALIYTMVLVSAADGDMTDAELGAIGEIVRYLPAFRGFDPERLPAIARDCTALLGDAEGLNAAFGAIRKALPETLRETAYVVACEVAAADGRASQEELRLLQMLRDKLKVDPLVAAAIERATRARAATL